MDAVNWAQLIIAILGGIATAIPLVIQLVKVVKSAIREKNWNQLVKMTMDYMTQAEKNFETGVERKEWVLSMVKTSAATINYTMTDEDITKISDLIDAICDASKIINNQLEKQAAIEAAEEKALQNTEK